MENLTQVLSKGGGSKSHVTFTRSCRRLYTSVFPAKHHTISLKVFLSFFFTEITLKIRPIWCKHSCKIRAKFLRRTCSMLRLNRFFFNNRLASNKIDAILDDSEQTLVRRNAENSNLKRPTWPRYNRQNGRGLFIPM